MLPPMRYTGRMAGVETGAGRVRRKRDALRVAGLRPVQVWVPDVRAAGFAAECARQAQVIREAETAASLDRGWFDASDKVVWTA